MKVKVDVERWVPGSTRWSLWGTMEMELASYEVSPGERSSTPAWPSLVAPCLTLFLDRGASPEGFYRLGESDDWVFHRLSGQMNHLDFEQVRSSWEAKHG